MSTIPPALSDVKSVITKNEALKKIAGNFAVSPTTDHIALISTATNAVKIYQKVILLPAMNQEEIKRNSYYTSVANTSLCRCIIAAIPAVGNLLTMGADLLRIFDSLKTIFPKNEQLDTFWKLCSFAKDYFSHPELPWVKKEDISDLISTKESLIKIKNEIENSLPGEIKNFQLELNKALA